MSWVPVCACVWHLLVNCQVVSGLFHMGPTGRFVTSKLTLDLVVLY